MGLSEEAIAEKFQMISGYSGWDLQTDEEREAAEKAQEKATAELEKAQEKEAAELEKQQADEEKAAAKAASK